jgi:agmatine deiminase
MKYHLSELVAAISAIIPFLAVVIVGADSIFAQASGSGGAGSASEPIPRASSQSDYRALPLPISRVNAVAATGDWSVTDEWVFPGEYESHQAMWMMWPTYENKVGFPSTEPMIDMIRAMSGHVQVNLAVQNADEELAVRELLTTNRVPLDHVHFFHIEHADIWARDMGPQFTRSVSGRLRITDWNFNMWGAEEPDSDNSTFSESFDRSIASAIRVPVVEAEVGPNSGVRMIHEGGSVTHNGRGTMIAVESVVIQRNMGPGRFCGGPAPVTDYSQPNTYAPSPHWSECKALVENEYRRMLGVKKVIWVPTGIAEDNGTFRGPLAPHIHVPRLNGIDIPHAGVYTCFTTNGHSDEFLRFVSPDTVVLAQETVSRSPTRTPVERLLRWLQEQNHQRLERVYDIISRETTESGAPIKVVRIPTPELTLEVFGPGDGQYDYFAAYDRWEDGSTLPEVMLAVWPASYVNYVPTNDLVLVPQFWKSGRSIESRTRDEEAREVLGEVFPGRKIVPVHPENLVRGGGGMNCITQQQPASARFAQKCGWAKVTVDAEATRLYAEPVGQSVVGIVPRITRSGGHVYMKRLSKYGDRVRVHIFGAIRLDGEIGWVTEADIESAGERCAAVYSAN